MTDIIDRRSFLRLAGYGGAVFASGLGLGGCATPGKEAAGDFYFVQLSDTHWGYSGAANPEAQTTLPKAIAAVNGLPEAPDFVVFTGDLTHLTLDAGLRRERMLQFREQAAALRVPVVHFLVGEHDASADHGAVFHDLFGPSQYSFDHKGVHFTVIDNVSDPTGSVGAEQIAWLESDLAHRPAGSPVVVLTHRPLFDLQPEWGWATKDGDKVREVLAAQATPQTPVTVLYGHIHQEHHHVTGPIAHHSAASLIFPLPAPGSGPDHKPLPWDTAHPYQGLAWRDVHARGAAALELKEHGLS